MRYKIERYKNCERFNEQYQGIHQFLLEAEKREYNEHFLGGVLNGCMHIVISMRTN